MSLLTFLWALGAGICVAFAALHGYVGIQRKKDPAHILFAVAALGVAAAGIEDLHLLHSESIVAYALTVKLQHIPLFVFVVSLVWFVVAYLGTARRWLAIVVTAAWAVVLVLDLVLPGSIVYSEVTELRRVQLWWGETFTTAVGIAPPWKHFADVAALAFLAFVVDASVASWRRGNRRRALALGGSLAFFAGATTVHSVLVDLGYLASPYLGTLFFLAVIVAMGLQLSRDVVRASALAAEVSANERRWRSLLEGVHLLVVGVDGRGQIDYANPSFCRMTGRPLSELRGRPLREFATLEGEALPAATGTDGPGEGPPPQTEGTVKTQSGEDRTVAWSRVGLTGPEGGALGLLCIGADVTEQRQAEAARDEALRRAETALREVGALRQRLEHEVVYLKDVVTQTGRFDSIVGESDALKYVLHRVEQVAPLDTTVLIEGETGVGKELVARAIHSRSRRHERPMVTVNCAALPPSLIEAELFGHEKGAFTGAIRTRLGRFELAHGSTLFLDEIGELPLELQGKLLRVIQEGEVERVGGDRPLRVDVRFIAATNRRLNEEVAGGRFREDLFYRLVVYPLTIPPLRQRREDIPALVGRLVETFTRQQGKRITRVPQPVLDELMAYDWPGNVRELGNVVERAVIVSSGDTLRLASKLREGNGPTPPSREPVMRGTLMDVEREYIAGVLKSVGWKIDGNQGAAERLGLHPNTLRFRMRKLGIKRPSPPSH